MATVALTRPARIGVPWRALVLGCAALLLLGALISRRPGLFGQPWFYAEDGTSFYADAHNLSGLGALFLPLGGYLVVFQRLVAAGLTPLGMTTAATGFVLTAFAVQLLPPLFFMSSRCRSMIADDRVRAVIAAVYVLIPNIELSGVLTNTQWHLAVLAFLFVMSQHARSRVTRVVELAALAVIGLTGPYALVLLPFVVVQLRRKRDAWRFAQLCVLAAAALTQLGVMIAQAASHPRGTLQLGVSAADGVFILPNQLLVRFFRLQLPSSAWLPAVLVTLAVIGIVVAGARRGTRELRCFVAYAALIAVLGLVFPYGATPYGATWWHTAAFGLAGTRYFFLLSLALVLCAFQIARRLGTSPRYVPLYSAAAAVALAGTLLHWQYPPFPAEHLAQAQQVLSAAHPGTVLTVPIYPDGWAMHLRAD